MIAHYVDFQTKLIKRLLKRHLN